MEETTLNIGPSAGMVRTLRDVELAVQSAATEITVGTISVERRVGNKPADGAHGRVYYFSEICRSSVNALGIPDRYGLEGYKTLLPEMVKLAHAHGKKLRVSIGAFKSDNELELLQKLCMECGVDEEEYNAGCPNIKDGGPKVIPSYDADTLTRQLGVFRKIGLRNVAVKISPIGRDLIPSIANVINRSGVVSRVVAVNTEPDFEMEADDGSPALNYYGGDNQFYQVGGGAGTLLYEDAVRVVRGMRKHLHSDIEVTGVGGIFEGRHALAHLEAGADKVQVGTGYYQFGPKILGDIAAGT